jgi:hypothetical protein
MLASTRMGKVPPQARWCFSKPSTRFIQYTLEIRFMAFPSFKLAALAIAAVGTLAAAPAMAGKTLDAIKARGQVVCGVNTGLAGFSAADSSPASGPAWTWTSARPWLPPPWVTLKR